MPSHRSSLRRLFAQPPMLMLAAAVLLACVALLPVTARAADGNRLGAGSGLRIGDSVWPRWQGRLALGMTAPASSLSNPLSPSAFAQPGPRTGLQSLSLLGDYYFSQQGTTADSRYSGGFRASGGVLWASRGTQWSLLPSTPLGLPAGFAAERRTFSLAAPSAAPEGLQAPGGSVPYLGVGYTGLRSITGTGGGWGFSADLGLMALQPSSAVHLGQQGLGDTLRDLQLSPLLHLGVSYSF